MMYSVETALIHMSAGEWKMIQCLSIASASILEKSTLRWIMSSSRKIRDLAFCLSYLRFLSILFTAMHFSEPAWRRPPQATANVSEEY